MNLVEELSQKARALSREERAHLAQVLLDSLREHVDPEIDAAWDEELRRRIAEIEAGTAKFIPAQEVFAEIRQLLE
jgi:putative addiction module component (TIGR02574 family)